MRGKMKLSKSNKVIHKVLDPDNICQNAEFGVLHGKFYFRATAETEWSVMKRMTLSPKRIKAMRNLVRKDSKGI